MPRLNVNVGHSLFRQPAGAKVRPDRAAYPRLGCAGPRNEAREALIDPHVLARIALLILVAGLVLAVAWWRVIHFPH